MYINYILHIVKQCTLKDGQCIDVVCVCVCAAEDSKCSDTANLKGHSSVFI